MHIHIHIYVGWWFARMEQETAAMPLWCLCKTFTNIFGSSRKHGKDRLMEQSSKRICQFSLSRTWYININVEHETCLNAVHQHVSITTSVCVFFWACFNEEKFKMESIWNRFIVRMKRIEFHSIRWTNTDLRSILGNHVCSRKRSATGKKKRKILHNTRLTSTEESR